MCVCVYVCVCASVFPLHIQLLKSVYCDYQRHKR